MPVWKTAAGQAQAVPQDLMFGEESAVAVLRLLCLLSAVQGGLPKKQADSLRRALLHAHGHPVLLVLSRLSRAGAEPVLAAADRCRSCHACLEQVLGLCWACAGSCWQLLAGAGRCWQALVIARPYRASAGPGLAIYHYLSIYLCPLGAGTWH